jgi:hypothetical protein
MSVSGERWAALDSKYERLVDITCPQPAVEAPSSTRRRWHHRIAGATPGHRGRLVRHGRRRTARSS